MKTSKRSLSLLITSSVSNFLKSGHFLARRKGMENVWSFFAAIVALQSFSFSYQQAFTSRRSSLILKKPAVETAGVTT